jgi:hypothetical protein
MEENTEYTQRGEGTEEKRRGGGWRGERSRQQQQQLSLAPLRCSRRLHYFIHIRCLSACSATDCLSLSAFEFSQEPSVVMLL